MRQAVVASGLAALIAVAGCTRTEHHVEHVRVELDEAARGDCARACEPDADRFECMRWCPGAVVAEGPCDAEARETETVKEPAVAVACVEREWSRSVVSKKKTVVAILAVPAAIAVLLGVAVLIALSTTTTH